MKDQTLWVRMTAGERDLVRHMSAALGQGDSITVRQALVFYARSIASEKSPFWADHTAAARVGRALTALTLSDEVTGK